MSDNAAYLKHHIATHLKTLRSEQKLSLDAVAARTGVSKAMLGQIEREESSPTIAKLWQIASGLNTSFSAFLGSAPQTVRAPEEHAERQPFTCDPDMQFTTLMPFDASVRFEMFNITLLNGHQQESPAHAHGVIEVIWVLEGELDMYCDNRWHHLAPNQTLRFYADQRHIYKAATAQVRFQNIVHYS